MSTTDHIRPDPADIPRATIDKWLRVRAEAGYTRPDSEIERDHSMRGGLLGWMMAGNEPLPHPPPLCFSRPWHQLCVDGHWSGDGPAFRWPGGSAVVINQGHWRLLDDLGNGEFLVTPGNTYDHAADAPGPWGVWKLTIGKDKGFGWKALTLTRKEQT